LPLVASPIVQAWYIPQQQAIVNSINSTKFKTRSDGAVDVAVDILQKS
jgi:hypothetical protein